MTGEVQNLLFKLGKGYTRLRGESNEGLKISGSRFIAGPVTSDDGQMTVRRRSYLRRFLGLTLVDVKLVSSLVH